MKTATTPKITCSPAEDGPDSCAACGVSNYDQEDGGEIGSNGFELFTVRISPNPRHSSSLVFCALCLKDLSTAIFPHRAGV